jgi:putative methyltransferase (TIGR04325 family)
MIRRLLHATLPPFVTSALRAIRRRYDLPEWEYVPEGWSRGPQVPGWDVESVAQAQEAGWEKYLGGIRAPRPLGFVAVRPSMDDYLRHNTLVSYAYVLALSARNRTRISILDWGGGVGGYYPLSRSVLPDVEISYCCRDLPTITRHARELLPEVRFTSDDSCLEAEPYDLVLASGSLQYSEDWPGTLKGLAGVTGDYLYLTRVPVALDHDSFVTLQRAYLYGYGTEYLGWVINREGLLRTVSESGLELVREFLIERPIEISGAPEPMEQRGYLFRRAISTLDEAGSEADVD